MTSFVTMTLRLFVLGSCWQLIQNADALVKYPNSLGSPLEVYGQKLSPYAKPMTSWKTPEHYLVFRNDVDLLVADEVDGKGFIVEKGDSHMVVTLGSQQVMLDQVGAWTESLNDRIRARDWVKFAAVAGDTDTIAMISDDVTFYCKRRSAVNIHKGATVSNWNTPEGYLLIRNEVEFGRGTTDGVGFIQEMGDSYMVVRMDDQHVVLDKVGAWTGGLKEVFNVSDWVKFAKVAGDTDTMTMTCKGVMFYCKERKNVYIRDTDPVARLHSIHPATVGTDANLYKSDGTLRTRPPFYFVIRNGVDCRGEKGVGLRGFVKEVTDNYIVVSLYNGEDVILDAMGEWSPKPLSSIKVGKKANFGLVHGWLDTPTLYIEGARMYHVEEPNSVLAKTISSYKAEA